MGVTSLIALIMRPAACRLLIALSRPEPGPFTNTSSSFTPKSLAFLAAFSAAIPAANGVDFFEPLKPADPVEAQQIVSPFTSVIVTIVLLNVAAIWAIAFGIFFVTFFFRFSFFDFLHFIPMFLCLALRLFALQRLRFCEAPYAFLRSFGSAGPAREGSSCAETPCKTRFP